MRMKWKAICLVAGLTAACSGNTGPTFDNADQDRIKAVIQQLTVAFNAKDAAKAAALYTPEAVVMPPNKTLMRGRSFVEQYYTGRFGEGATNLELQPNEIKGSGTLAAFRWPPQPFGSCMRAPSSLDCRSPCWRRRGPGRGPRRAPRTVNRICRGCG
jgi:hypothetical protein